jgi:surfeit locus 1 family protein
MRLGWIAVAVLVVVCVTGRLGFWQLSRAAEKQAWQDALVQQQALPELPLTVDWLQVWQNHPAEALTVRENGLLHRRVLVQGTWLPQFNVFLDNRQMDGQAGFFLLTPLALSNSDQVVWVQRGWLPRNFQQREKLPDMATPAGVVSLHARVALAPSKLMALGQAAPSVGFVHLRQNLDEDELRRETGLNLLSGSLVQLPQDGLEDGLKRDWYLPAADTAKHHGYAIQWFGMALLAAAWFVWYAFVRVRRF